MAVQLFTLGFLSLLSQVVILRELSVASYGIELIYLLAMGFWLFGTGAGSALARRRGVSSAAPLYFLLILFAVMLPLEMVFVRAMRLLFGAVTGSYLSFPSQLGGIALAVLPCGILLGLFFPWAASLYMQKSRSLASAYAVECAGAAAGGLASTLFLRIGLQNLAIALMCALFSATTVVFLIGRASHNALPFRKVLLSSSVALSLLLLFALVLSSRLDEQMTGWNHPFLLYSWDTPYGRVSVTRHEGQVSVYENDALSFETEGTSAEEFVHPALLEHAAPRTVLLLGGGLEGAVREAMKHSPERIDYIELNGRLLTGVAPLLPDSGMIAANSVHLRVADPRRELERLRRFDVILVAMPDPASASANRYYTREFFMLVRSHLNDHGVLAFRLRSAENYWTAPLALRNASIVGALKDVFPDVVVLPGASNVVIAGKDHLIRDPETLETRFAERRLRTRLVTPPYLRYLLTNDRFSEIATRLSAESAPQNVDARPVSFSYATTVWLSKFMPRLFTARFTLARVFAEHQVVLLIAIAAIIAIVSKLFCQDPSRRAILLAGIAGFCGMLVETALILRYQVKTGVLYQNIGLLLTLFMLGLTLGAWGADRKARRAVLRRRSGPVFIMVFVLTAGMVAWMIRADLGASLLPTGILLAICGISVAAVFTYASALAGWNQSRSASRLYGADLIGGGIGTLLGTLVWIPLAGLAATVGLALAVLIAAMALV